MERTNLMAAILRYLERGENDMARFTAEAHDLVEWLEWVRSTK